MQMYFILVLVYLVLVFLVGCILKGEKKLWMYIFYGVNIVFSVGMLAIIFLFADASWMPYKQYIFGGFITIFLTLLCFLLTYILGVLFQSVFRRRKKEFSDKGKASRRSFVKNLSLAFAAVPFGSLIYAMTKGKYRFQVIKHALYFDNLPDAFDGYKITQISDIHSGSFDSSEKVSYAIDLINEQGSDLLLFTGDLVNIRAKEMLPWRSFFAKLHAPDGCYSVLGNHDYGDYAQWDSLEQKQENLNLLKDIHKQIGFDLLLNSHRSIFRKGEKLILAGVENWGAGRFSKHGDLNKAFDGVSDDEFKILMSHDPTHWEYKVLNFHKRIDLTLSGHTHGMQFGIEIPGWVKWSPSQWVYKHWAGMYNQGKKYLNVNRGFGYLAFPGRLGIWPEITVIELKKKL